MWALPAFGASALLLVAAHVGEDRPLPAVGVLSLSGGLGVGFPLAQLTPPIFEAVPPLKQLGLVRLRLSALLGHGDGAVVLLVQRADLGPVGVGVLQP